MFTLLLRPNSSHHALITRLPPRHWVLRSHHKFQVRFQGFPVMSVLLTTPVHQLTKEIRKHPPENCKKMVHLPFLILSSIGHNDQTTPWTLKERSDNPVKTSSEWLAIFAVYATLALRQSICHKVLYASLQRYFVATPYEERSALWPDYIRAT